MKKRIFSLGLGLLLVTALAVTAGPTAEKAETPEAVGPQYGGTLTVFGGLADPPSPAFADVQYPSITWLQNIQERPVMGDTEKYGPRGTGEYLFCSLSYQPDKYLRGCLLESWETNLDRLVWHVRPGIMWAPTEDQMNRGVMKQPRELTAEDVVLDIIEFLECPWQGRFEGFVNIDDPASVVYATDKYSLVIEMDHYNPMVFYYIMYEDRALIAPPETIAAGADKWQNQIGTGAFMFEEYVTGASMSFVRNPDYWNSTTIDGTEYQMPFADRVVRPIIADVATQMAALQTGKLDIGRNILNTYWSMLDSRASEMKQINFSSGEGYRIYMRCDEPPFDNGNVRRAAMIGTNLMEFKRSAMVPDTPLLFHPVIPQDPSYIPLEELPENIQILFEYDPTLAKEMLAQEGYPDGFKTKLHIDAEQVQWHDKAALLKDQWSKIGIDVEIVAEPYAVYKDRGFPIPEVQYHGLYADSGGNANPVGSIDTMLRSSGLFNRSMYRSQQVDDIMLKLDVELDPDKKISMIREILLLVLPEYPTLQLHYNQGRTYWWPWVKNYYGELTLEDDGGFTELFPFIWIDRGLKESMGF